MADRPVVTVKFTLDQIDTLRDVLQQHLDESTRRLREQEIPLEEKSQIRKFGGKVADLQKFLQ